MTSYFEIGGHIVECHGVLTSPSSLFSLVAPRAPAAPRASGAPVALSSNSVGKDTDSLSEHWFKTSFHVLRELGELDRRQQIYFMKNPYHFAGWGVGKISEVIEMHWDYNKQRQAEWRGE